MLLRLPYSLQTADVAYNYEGVPCVRDDERRRKRLPSPSVTGAVVCTTTTSPHEEPLNCGQLVLNSLPFAGAVWNARPAVFFNGMPSQQHYANKMKSNFSHAALPLEFFNYCWQAHHTARVVDYCQLVTFHATCALRASEKLTMMRKVLQASNQCARSSPASYATALRAHPLATNWTFA